MLWSTHILVSTNITYAYQIPQACVQRTTDSFPLIYDMRKEAALTQAQLAEKIGTARSVISQLEDADYEGHSLSMLRRIAGVLNKRVELSLVDMDEQEMV